VDALAVSEAMEEAYVQPDKVSSLCPMRALVDNRCLEGGPKELPKSSRLHFELPVTFSGLSAQVRGRALHIRGDEGGLRAT
jgi:hypothetical protein